MCRVTIMNASWDSPAAPSRGTTPPSGRRRRQRYEKISSGATSSLSSLAEEEEAEGRRAASESCLLSLASFTESLSYRPSELPASPPPPPPLSDRKRTKEGSPLSLRRRKNRKLFAFEEEFSLRRNASVDSCVGGYLLGECVDGDASSVPRFRSLHEESRSDRRDDVLSPLLSPAGRRIGPGLPRPSSSSSSSSSSCSLPPIHPKTQIDVGRTFDADHLMMAEGIMTIIPITPTKGMAGGPGFLSLGNKAAAAMSNGGFWVLQS